MDKRLIAVDIRTCDSKVFRRRGRSIQSDRGHRGSYGRGMARTPARIVRGYQRSRQGSDSHGSSENVRRTRRRSFFNNGPVISRRGHRGRDSQRRRRARGSTSRVGLPWADNRYRPRGSGQGPRSSSGGRTLYPGFERGLSGREGCRGTNRDQRTSMGQGNATHRTWFQDSKLSRRASNVPNGVRNRSRRNHEGRKWGITWNRVVVPLCVG